MAQTALRLRHKTSAWASWLPRWPTCMCAINFRATRPTTFFFRFLFLI